jgi:hypothetical protein
MKMKGHEISLRRFTNLEFRYMIVQSLPYANVSSATSLAVIHSLPISVCVLGHGLQLEPPPDPPSIRALFKTRRFQIRIKRITRLSAYQLAEIRGISQMELATTPPQP